MTDISVNGGENHGALDHRVAALAEVAQMHQDLISANDEIASLKREIDREQDRVSLLIGERDRYRHEATVFRSKLIELATAMANIGLLTMQAQEIMKIAQEMAMKEAFDEILPDKKSD